ncbi:MAG: hypothetical protein IJM38_01475 [Ruminococcus sp.]|nr:hypothetical protein [Ruminococcus sp.]
MFFEEDNTSAPSPKKVFICAILFMTIGIIFIGIGINRYVTTNNLRKKCSKKVTATCIDIKTVSLYSKGGTRKAFYPIFKYEIDGQLYEVASSYSISNDSSIGKTAQVTLYVDPIHHRTFLYDEAIKKRKANSRHFIEAGIAIIIISFIIAQLCLHTYDPVERYKLEKHQDDSDDTEYY